MFDLETTAAVGRWIRFDSGFVFTELTLNIVSR